MGSENPTEVFLKVTAELETLKRLIEGVTGAGTAAQKASGEIDKMGEALKEAINPAEVQRLNAELDKLAAEQKELTAELNKLRTANTAAAQATAQLKAECQKLALQVDGAKNSAAAWQAESRRVSAEVDKLRGYLASAVTGLVRLSDAQNAAAASARQNAASQQQQSDEIKETSSAAFDLRTILALLAAGAVKSMGSALVDAELDMNRLRMTLFAAQGSASAAANSLNFVTQESDRIGVSMMATAPSFARFSVSANNAGVAAEESRRIFTAFSEAAVVLGLSTAETEGVFRALEQMFSKGNVQAEELRGQLGERLPGAFNLSAQALGVTTQQLNKMLEQGQVLASDLVPKLATVVQRQFAGALPMAMNSTQAELNRLNNEFLQLKLTINELGFTSEFTEKVRQIGEILAAVTKYARENREQMELLGEVIKSIGWALLLAGAAASALKLSALVATVTPAVAALAGLAVQVALVNALIQRAIDAYGEMREAQLDAEGQNGRIIASLIESVKAMKDAGDASAALRQATVQLNAAQAAGDTEMVDRIESIIRLIKERGDAIIRDNVVENERLAILQKQTDEVQKQRDEIAKRVSQLPKTEKEYEKARFSSLSPEDQMTELLKRRSDVDKSLSQPFKTGNASTPDEINNAFLAFRQREMELLTEKFEIQAKIQALDAKAQQQLDQTDREIRQIHEEEAKRVDRARAKALNEEADQIRRVREGRLAQIESNRFLTEREKEEQRYIVLLEEQKQLTEEIQRLKELTKLEPEGSATRAAAEQRLSAAQDRQQFGLPADIEKNRPLSMGEDIRSQMVDLENGFRTVASSIKDVMGDAIDSASQGIQGLIKGTMDLGQAAWTFATGIGESIIRAISDAAAQWLIKHTLMAGISKLFAAGEVADKAAAESAKTAIAAGGAGARVIVKEGEITANAALTSVDVATHAAGEGTKTAATGFGAVGRGIIRVGETIFEKIQIGMRVAWHIAGETAKTIGTMIAATVRIGIIIAESIAHVIQAGVGALASLSSIPYVGPILGLAAMAATIAAGMALVKGISKGFATGGYTGDGGVFEPAGIVHKGEVVFSQSDVARAGGVEMVEAMRVSGGAFRPSTAVRPAGGASAVGGVSGGAAAPTINMAFFDSRVSAEKWAASQEGQTHIVDVVQRNLHQITGNA